MTKTIVCSWLILDDQWRILLIKRGFDKSHFPNYWSFPWGRQEKWESIDEVVIREVEEEVWLKFEITNLFIKEEWPYNYFYRFLWKYHWNILLQEEECDWYGWFSYNETKKLLINSAISNVIQKLYEKKLLKE